MDVIVSHSFAGANLMQRLQFCSLVLHAAERKHISQALTRLEVTERSVCI